MLREVIRRPRSSHGNSWRLLAVAALLALIGAGSYVAGCNIWAWYHLRAAEKAFEKRDLDQARTHLEQCLRVWSGSTRAHFLAAQTARLSESYEEAEQHLTICQRQLKDSDALVLERALIHAQMGDLTPNLERHLLTLVAQGGPETGLILEALSRGYLQAYNLTAALDVLNQWLEHDPENPRALERRGWVYERLYRVDEALLDYQRVVENDPDKEGVRLRLAEALLYTSRHGAAEATPHFERLWQKAPGNPTVVRGLAQCRFEVGRLDEAEQLLDEALRSHRDDPALLTQRGKLALQFGQLEQAEVWLREALRLAPSSHEACYALQQCLERQGKKSEAEDVLRRLKEIDAESERLAEMVKLQLASPRDAGLRYQIAQILHNQSKEAESVNWLFSALQADPYHAPTHAALAEYFERTGNLELAAQHRQRAGPTRGMGAAGFSSTPGQP